MSGTLHIVGAGVAGLACAVRLAGAGRRVVLHEAAGKAGGRCRSFDDEVLGRHIDNGNHLLLSGNWAVAAYLKEVEAEDELVGPPRAEFSFVDLADGARWTVAPGEGRFPWWLFDSGRRVPGSDLWDYLQGLRLAWAGPQRTVADCLDRERPLYRRFWEPLAVGVLNTAAEEGAAALLWPVLKETFGQGEAACRPRVARTGLSRTFVDPALAVLAQWGADIRLNHRLRALKFDSDQVVCLEFADGPLRLGPDDQVILAVPAWTAGGLVPGLETPVETRAIVNGHFRLPAPLSMPSEAGPVPMVGVVGGLCQWLFVRGDIISVTISAANGVVDLPAEEIAARMWPEIKKALSLPREPPPPCRIVKEKRATIAQTPAQAAHRPDLRTRWQNLLLVGDWTATGLPATIEGAIRSGHHAADALLRVTTSP